MGCETGGTSKALHVTLYMRSACGAVQVQSAGAGCPRLMREYRVSHQFMLCVLVPL